MAKNDRFSRPIALVIAIVVLGLTVSVINRATATVLGPNASQISYHLAAGANSGPVGPVANVPVLVMGTCTTVGTRGVGQVSLLRIAGAFLEWTGIESPAGAALTSGFSAAPGTHIVYIDFAHQVDIEVNTADTFRIHNGAGAARFGVVTLFW